MLSRWSCFWFSPVSTENLALLRIFFGAAFFMKLTGTARFFLGDGHTMRFPLHTFNSENSYFLGSFRLPITGFAWITPPSLGVYRAVESLVLVLCVFFIAGLLTRWLGPLLVILYGYLFILTQFTYSHHGFLFLIALSLLACSPCSGYLSVDSYLGTSRNNQVCRVLPIRMIQILVTTIYLFSFVSKLNEGWFDGTVISILVEDGRLDGDLAPLATFVPPWCLSLGVLVLEGFLVFSFWNRRLRSTAILVGSIMHVGLDMMMDVTTFGIQMMVLYIAFIDPVTRKTAVFYDGACPLCARSIRLLSLLDWFQRFAWLDFRNSHVRSLIRCVDDEELENQMVLVTPTGGIELGFQSWRYILRKLPLTFIPSHILHLPIISNAGRGIYHIVARSRLGVVHCSPGRCGYVHPRIVSRTEGPWLESVRLANDRRERSDMARTYC